VSLLATENGNGDFLAKPVCEFFVIERAAACEQNISRPTAATETILCRSSFAGSSRSFVLDNKTKTYYFRNCVLC